MTAKDQVLKILEKEAEAIRRDLEHCRACTPVHWAGIDRSSSAMDVLNRVREEVLKIQETPK